MPTYRYRCERCGDEREVWQSFSEDPLSTHEGDCGGPLVKVLTPAGIVLKGPGFYKTDSRSNGKRRTSTGSSKDSSSETAGSKKEKSDSSGSGGSDSGSSSGSSGDSKPAASSSSSSGS